MGVGEGWGEGRSWLKEPVGCCTVARCGAGGVESWWVLAKEYGGEPVVVGVVES